MALYLLRLVLILKRKFHIVLLLVLYVVMFLSCFLSIVWRCKATIDETRLDFVHRHDVVHGLILCTDMIYDMVCLYLHDKA